MQPGLRNMHGMYTNASNSSATNTVSMRIRFAQTVLTAVLVAAGTSQAGEVPVSTVERPLNLSLPRHVYAGPEAPEAPGDVRVESKPYGSGYEARGFGTSWDKSTSAPGRASGTSTGESTSGLRGASAGPGTGAGGSDNRSGAGRRGRR